MRKGSEEKGERSMGIHALMNIIFQYGRNAQRKQYFGNATVVVDDSVLLNDQFRCMHYEPESGLFLFDFASSSCPKGLSCLEKRKTDPSFLSLSLSLLSVRVEVIISFSFLFFFCHSRTFTILSFHFETIFPN